MYHVTNGAIPKAFALIVAFIKLRQVKVDSFMHLEMKYGPQLLFFPSSQFAI